MAICLFTTFCLTSLQSHGGAGLSGDFVLAKFHAKARVLKIADGPDAVHLRAVSKNEFKTHSKL